MAQKKRKVFTRRMLIEHDYRDEAQKFFNERTHIWEIHDYVEKLFKEEYIADPNDESPDSIVEKYFDNLEMAIALLDVCEEDDDKEEELTKSEPEPKHNYKEYHRYWIRGNVFYYPEKKSDNMFGNPVGGWVDAASPEEAIEIYIGRLVLEASKNKKYHYAVKVKDFRCEGMIK